MIQDPADSRLFPDRPPEERARLLERLLLTMRDELTRGEGEMDRLVANNMALKAAADALSHLAQGDEAMTIINELRRQRQADVGRAEVARLTWVIERQGEALERLRAWLWAMTSPDGYDTWEAIAGGPPPSAATMLSELQLALAEWGTKPYAAAAPAARAAESRILPGT